MTLSLQGAGIRQESASTRSLTFSPMIGSSGRLGDGRVGREPSRWNAVLFCSPGSKIRDLTTLGTEWAPRIFFPRRGPTAQGTGHERSVTPAPNEVQPMKHRMISALGYSLGFLNLGPRIFQRHGSVEDEGLR
jgi:hypothetical protein